MEVDDEESKRGASGSGNKRKSDQVSDHRYKKAPGIPSSNAGQTLSRKNDQQPGGSIDTDVPKYFQDNNEGPYTVWIQYRNLSEKDTHAKRLSPLKVGRIICSRYKNINLICSKSKSKIEVSFKNLYEANKLVSDQILNDYDLEAFIPRHRLMRRGLIKRVDEDMPESEILEAIESPVKVLQVRRLNRRNRTEDREEDDPKWIPSGSVVVTFSGQILPSEVYIHKVRFNVEPYMTLPIICFNCFKYGHPSKVCISDAKCIMCSEKKHEGGCTGNSPACSNCNGNHRSTDRNCLVFLKEYEVRRLMAYENIAMNDAKKLVYYKTKQKFRPGIEEFPIFLEKNSPSFGDVARNGPDSSISNQRTAIPRRVHRKVSDLQDANINKGKAQQESVNNVWKAQYKTHGKQESYTRSKNESIVREVPSYVEGRIKDSNQFYKEQKENCEFFIGSRNKSVFSNGVALHPGVYEQRASDSSKGIPEVEKELEVNEERDTLKYQRGSIQQAVLGDVTNKREDKSSVSMEQAIISPPDKPASVVKTYGSKNKLIGSRTNK